MLEENAELPGPSDALPVNGQPEPIPVPEPSRPRVTGAEFAASIRAHEVRDFSDHLIDGPVDLNAADYPHKLVVRRAIFTGHFDVSEARFGRTVDLEGCTFEQSVHFPGCRIGGSLILNSATIRRRGIGEHRADFELIRVEGNFRADRLQSEPGLNFRAAQIAGDFWFHGSSTKEDLYFQSAKIVGSVFCRPMDGHRTEIGGEAWLVGAEIGGQVDFSGVSIQDNLNLQAATVIGGVFFMFDHWHRTEIGGLASLSGAKVGGVVDFSGAAIKGELNLQAASVAGGFFCRLRGGHRTEVGGAIWLSSANVGQVDFGGASISRDLDLQRATVIGGVFFRPLGGHHTEVGGDLVFVGLKASHVELDGQMCRAGTWWLDQADLGKLKITEKLPEGNVIKAEGLIFQQIEVPESAYIDFLDRTKGFQKSTYRFLETWLRDQGEDEKANEVYRQMRRKDRDIDRLEWKGLRKILPFVMDRIQGFFSWLLLDKLTGYGTQSMRLGWILAASLVLTAWLFSWSGSVERKLVATVGDAAILKAKGIEPVNPDPKKGDWSGLHATWLSLRMHLPLVSIMASDDWEPAARPIRTFDVDWPKCCTYQHFAALWSSLCLVLVPLFVAGISGLIKKQQ